MSLSIVHKKVRLSHVIMVIVLGTAVLGGLFAWSYYRNIDIFNTVKNVIPATQPGEPKYLYTIRGNETSNLKWPQYTYATNDRIFVSDVSGVWVFDYNGKFLQMIRPKDKAPGAFKFPVGLLVVNDELYVADYVARKVSVFGMDGKFKRYFAEKVLKVPAFIKYKDNKFYVYDMAGTKIKILDAQGSLIKELAGAGSKKGQLAYPFDLNVDNEGKIWVADSNNYRIQVFDQEGKLLNMWPKGSDNPSRNERKTYPTPRGIAFDKDGFVWTANTITNYISAIDPIDGEVLKQYSTGEDEADTISIPNVVFIDANNRLYITELGSKRILVYQL